MIGLYRMVHHPDYTFVLFQGDSSDVKQISQILRFSPGEAKWDFEKGHFAYLRGKWREKSEREVSQYLRSHYRALPLDVSIFTTDQPLPRSLRRYQWRFLITDCINNYFEARRYLLDKEESTIYRREPRHIGELEGYEGIGFTLHISQEWKPYLTCNLSYRYHINGELASRRVIDDYSLEKPEIFDQKHAFETRNMDCQFKLIRDFMRSLPAIPETDNLRFRTEPMISTELGYETWLWEHEMKPMLEVGQGREVPLAHWISEYNLGLYEPPPADLHVIYVHPDTTLDGWCNYVNWNRLGTIIKNKLFEFLGHHVALHELSYSLDLTDSNIQAKIDQLPEFDNNVLSVMIIPPHVKTGHALFDLNNNTFVFRKRLSGLKKGAYVSTAKWTNLLPDRQQYVVENCLLKGFMAIGAQPWRLATMPLSGSEPHSTCFIGIDAIEQRGIIGGVVLDVWGILHGYHFFKIPRETCENVNPYTFADLTTQLIQYFELATSNQVKHLILHRDGRCHPWERSLLPQKLADRGITLDLVEIRKRNQPLLRQVRNRSGTPSKDIAVGNCKLDKAYLNNTLSFAEKIGEKHIFPAPQSICVVKLEGPTPFQELVAQVHALTRVNYGAYRRPVKEPATIYYADAMVGNVSLKASQPEFGSHLGPDKKPYWL